MSHPSFSHTPHILIVDDEPDNFDVIEGFLFSEKYQLSYVRSSKSALARLEKHVPDLIIVDAMMPDMDGFSFCRRFKKNKTMATYSCHYDYGSRHRIFGGMFS